jgi:hypothetical protein
MPNDQYYVYLLVEDRLECEEVFYVGKGKNTRGAATFTTSWRPAAQNGTPEMCLAWPHPGR